MHTATPDKPRVRVTPGAMTIGQVAIELQISTDTVRRWIRNGDLESIVLPSGRRRVPLHALRALQTTNSEA